MPSIGSCWMMILPESKFQINQYVAPHDLAKKDYHNTNWVVAGILKDEWGATAYLIVQRSYTGTNTYLESLFKCTEDQLCADFRVINNWSVQ